MALTPITQYTLQNGRNTTTNLYVSYSTTVIKKPHPESNFTVSAFTPVPSHCRFSDGTGLH